MLFFLLPIAQTVLLAFYETYLWKRQTGPTGQKGTEIKSVLVSFAGFFYIPR